MVEKSLGSNFKLQVTILGFDRRFVQVCRLWKYIFNRTDIYYFHCIFYVNVIYIFMYNIYKAHYSQFNML